MLMISNGDKIRCEQNFYESELLEWLEALCFTLCIMYCVFLYFLVYLKPERSVVE